MIGKLKYGAFHITVGVSFVVRSQYCEATCWNNVLLHLMDLCVVKVRCPLPLHIRLYIFFFFFLLLLLIFFLLLLLFLWSFPFPGIPLLILHTCPSL